MDHPNFQQLQIKRLNEPEKRWLNLFEASYTTNNNKTGVWQFASRNKNPELTPNMAAVVIIAFVIEEGFVPMLLVTSEFRIPIGTREYGFPAGLIDSNESIEETVRRELKEESGLNVEEILQISPPLVSSAGLSDEAVNIVFVTASGQLNSDGNEASEDIKSYLMNWEEINLLVHRKNQYKDVAIAAKAWPILFMLSMQIPMNGIEKVIDNIKEED